LQLTGCLKTIHYWHRKIKNHEIGLELQRFIQAFAAVDRFAANFPAGLSAQQSAQAMPDGGAIVDN
jgi:hypothetical protein